MPSWTDIVVGLFTLQLAYTIYVVVSRLFLSPLRNIPGPKLAAVTSWYEFYFDVIQQGRFVWKVKDLHLEYGLAVLPRLKIRSLIYIIRRSYRANHTLGDPCERCRIPG